MVSAAGYGTASYYLLQPLLILFCVLALPSCRTKGLTGYVCHLVVIAGLTLILFFAGVITRRVQKILVCRRLNELTERVQTFRSRSGRYPTNLAELGSMPAANSLSLQVGTCTDGQISLAGLNEHDATVFFPTNGFICVVPVTKLLPVSITRFYVYQWTPEEPTWKYEKVIWMLGIMK